MKLSPFVLASAVMAGMASAHEYSSNNSACTRNYKVVAGDTCDIIGQKTWTSTYQILAFNLPKAGDTCETLEIGATLCLGRYGNDCQAVHRCRNSDTCYSIASQYSIPLSLLRDNNPSLDCDSVYDGLVLCVAPGVMRPPPVDALNAAIKAQKKSGRSKRRRSQEPGAEDVVESSYDEAAGEADVIEALRAKTRHAGGASRHSKGIHSPVLSHHS
ncbi:unnamed protein product [Parajaminaea phylloscopi]